MSTINPDDVEQTSFEKERFEAARTDTLVCGFLLACHKTLLIALRDRRLHQKHRGVLAVLIEHMNRKTGMAWPGRDKIGSELGLAPETVSNSLRDLKNFGYILFENRRTPETSNRSLRHYTLAGLSRAELEQQLTEAIVAIKQRVPKVVKPDSPASIVTTRSDFESHRPQCLTVDISNQKSPPAVDESHRGQWTVTELEELKRKKGEESVSVTAHAREKHPPRPSLEIVAFSRPSDELVFDDSTATRVMSILGIANGGTRAQRTKCADTFTKAARRWEGRGRRDERYKNFSDWFESEWLPGLRDDLDKLTDATTPRRFTIDLEKQFLFGKGGTKFSRTKAGVNALLDDAEKLLDGIQTTIIDFETIKATLKYEDGASYHIALAALVRVHGDSALSLADAERQALKSGFVDEGFPKGDVNLAVDELGCVCSLRDRHSRGVWEWPNGYPLAASKILFNRSNYQDRARAFIRAALPVIANDRLVATDRAGHYRPSRELSFPEPSFNGELVPL